MSISAPYFIRSLYMGEWQLGSLDDFPQYKAGANAAYPLDSVELF